MIAFIINGHKIDFDETKQYSDFTTNGGQPELWRIDVQDQLNGLANNQIEWNPEIWQWLSRWVHEAPRKRNLRQLRSTGMNVLTSEFLFDGWDKADEFIDSLENTGKIAVELLLAMNTRETHKPFGPNWYKEHLPGGGNESIAISVQPKD